MMIYLVTSGDYSNYHIIGAFSSEEKAIEIQKKFSADYIEEYELDLIGRDDRFLYTIRIDSRNNEIIPYIAETKLEKLFNTFRQDTNWLFYLEVLAEDREHATKIASDLWFRYKAENNIS